LDQILNLALKDNVLIRGWGAAALFQGIRGVICVRVCAPMALRVRVMMERLGVKDANAMQQEFESFDTGHSRAMRAAFNFDWNDALLYHIVLNSARISTDACVNAVCQLAEHPDLRDDPTTISAALTDKLLQAKINSALAEHISRAMAPARITVSVADGKVTLVGTPDSGGTRDKAEKLAQGIAGVREIDNRIISVPSRGSRLFPELAASTKEIVRALSVHQTSVTQKERQPCEPNLLLWLKPSVTTPIFLQIRRLKNPV
jgi:Cytidylate kinase-like family/BON domain